MPQSNGYQGWYYSISLYCLLNSKVCLNWNLTPLFKLTEIINISLTSFFRFVLKVTEPCFFPLEFIARVLRLGHRAGKPWSVTYFADLKRDLSFIVRLIRLRKIPKIETSSLYHCTDDPKRDRKNMKKSCKNWWCTYFSISLTSSAM